MTDPKRDFLSAADEWICDDYAIDIRYIARPTVDGPVIVNATIGIYPLKAQTDSSFCIHTENILARQILKYPAKKAEIHQLLDDATEGRLRVDKTTLEFRSPPPFDYYSEMSHRDRWFSELHLQIGCGMSSAPFPHSLSTVDSDLRSATPPFDGLSDLASWLGFNTIDFNGGRPTITVRVGPPVDLIFDRCKLSDDQLTLEFHAHPSFDANRLTLAIRGVPGNGLLGRKQIASLINWQDATEGKRIGTVNTRIPNSDSVLTMLLIGASTVRRQWLGDAAKARNNRWMAVQHFDTNLEKVRSAVLKPSDSRKFEQGVASLLFLLGFSPAVQIETDAPDLIVATPGGHLTILECTTRIADFSSKLGKLVDRRVSLSKSLTSAGHASEILAVLVCGTERDQIATHEDALRNYRVLLLTREDLGRGLDRVRQQEDPDKLISEAKMRLDLNATNGF